jgi:mannose-6-phosphate isomerase
VELIEGVIRGYDWGSRSSIPELLGIPASGEPMAELWLGAHPSAPALVGSDGVPLDRVVADDVGAALGPAARLGELPFLLKVLAAAEPLSLQAHPSATAAKAGFAREEAAGIPLDAPERSFRDESHKPELICALTEFEALCGFRDPQQTLEVLASIGTAGLDTVCDMIRIDPSATGLSKLLEWLLTRDAADAAALVDPVVSACRDGHDGPYAQERAMAVALGDRYPGDSGVVTALLLNRVTLQPGEALFLEAGNLHMYLHGTGVEIMASSDNVLRGGLTPKHVDVDALVEVVDATPLEPEIQRPPLVDGVAVYASPVEEFSLTRIELDGSIVLEPGPAILLCTSGRAVGAGHTLERGTAAWVPAVDGPLELMGRATVFRAGLGPGVPLRA